MFQYYLPVLFVVAFNSLYHICAKQMPAGANPLALLVVTYGIAAGLAFAAFMLTDASHDFMGQMKHLSWAPVVLGVCVVALEFGFILVYKVGWSVSLASLVCNIALAAVLLLIGVLFYKEHLNLSQVVGIFLCAAGLLFINRK